MPKKIEDVVHSNSKRSIRDIPIPEGRRRISREKVSPARPTSNSNPATEELEIPKAKMTQKPPKVKSSGNSRKKWLVALVTLVLATFVGLSVFSSGTLSYTPKTANLTFNNDIYTTNKSDGALLYSMVKVSREKGLEVRATGEEKVERKASGTIVVYNAHSTRTERLDENTRFETPDGKWYRIKDGISIPGKKTVGGKVVPGTTEVVAYADEPGESYNIGLTDFVLPGYKGKERYKTIYARSKTPMTDGFVGVEKVVDPTEAGEAKRNLEISLREELLAQAESQVPEDFVLLKDLSTLTYEDMPQTNLTESSVTINMRGHYNALMFKRSELSTHLASKKTSIGDGEQVEIRDFDSLTFELVNAPQDILGASKLDFKVSGSAEVVWYTDTMLLKSELRGRSKGDVSSIINNYPSIVSAEAVLRPFWKKSFPKDTMDIRLKEVL